MMTETFCEKKNQLTERITILVAVRYLQYRRACEIVIILVLCPFILIVVLILAALIRIFDRGPIFFSQRRPGKYGETFVLYKFRTMVPKCDTSILSSTCDNRVTKIGAVLRRLKLDEIPQLLNVLKGDMSIIGPRPVPENFYMAYIQQIPGYSLRHLIRPGITGLAQVRLGYTNTVEQEQLKLKFDLDYIRNIGITLDLRILGDTALCVLRNRKILAQQKKLAESVENTLKISQFEKAEFELASAQSLQL